MEGCARAEAGRQRAAHPDWPDTPMGRVDAGLLAAGRAGLRDVARTCLVKALWLLGEDLALFKKEASAGCGLITRCRAHRGVPTLSYGRLEDGGLRCFCTTAEL